MRVIDRAATPDVREAVDVGPKAKAALLALLLGPAAAACAGGALTLLGDYLALLWLVVVPR